MNEKHFIMSLFLYKIVYLAKLNTYNLTFINNK